MLRRDPLANPERLIRRVYSYVAYRLGDGSEAEDVTSEVFERALPLPRRVRPRQGRAHRLAPWDRSPLRGHSLRSRQVHVEDTEHRAASGDLEQDAVRRLELAQAVARLDPRAQELVALRYGADLTAAQIARLLDMRPNTVEVALHRALARLRELLEAPSESPAPREEAITGAQPKLYA